MKRGVLLKSGEVPPARKRGVKRRADSTFNAQIYKLEWQRDKRASQRPRIAVLDMETTPFDGESEILPFCCEIWDGENALVIWEDDYQIFLDKLMAALTGLDPAFKWVVYAHNGGKFDFMFLVQNLRGYVSFKGRSIMSAMVAPHVELRDSYHIIPDKLKSYKKQDFDYKKLRSKVRAKHRKEILEYLHSDCVNLYDLVTHFNDKHGLKLSIGQAAWACLKKDYPIETIGEAADTYLRQWYYGGRVECLRGPGLFEGSYVLEDVNSMYPDRMAYCEHPIGAEFSIRTGKPNPNKRTVFLEVECINFGALAARDENGSLTFNVRRGTFKTTIWEYEAALELGLIENVRIIKCVDFYKRSTFAKFVIPRYDGRQKLKDQIDQSAEGNLRDELERDSLIVKLEMNNAYGKGAQNPRKFAEYLYTDIRCRPDGERVGINEFKADDGKIWKLHMESEGEFFVWKKPIAQLRFNHVGLSASITGAARAKLLRKLHSVKNVVYCDTDSVICADTGQGGSNALGDWKREKSVHSVLIAGKKLYGYRGTEKGKAIEIIRSKGGAGLQWNELAAIVAGGEIVKTNIAPKFDKAGYQDYVGRTFKLTCPSDYRSNLLEKTG